jgi:hypothetical protein
MNIRISNNGHPVLVIDSTYEVLQGSKGLWHYVSHDYQIATVGSGRKEVMPKYRESHLAYPKSLELLRDRYNKEFKGS